MILSKIKYYQNSSEENTVIYVTMNVLFPKNFPDSQPSPNSEKWKWKWSFSVVSNSLQPHGR